MLKTQKQLNMENKQYDPYVLFTKRTLSNGMSLYHANIENRNFVRIRLIIHSGAITDPVGKEGLAHFVEHLFSRNGDMPRDQMEKYFHLLGRGLHTGSTNSDSVKYGCVLPVKREVLEPALQHFFSMYAGIYNLNEFEAQRKVVEEEFHEKNKFPLMNAHALWKNTILYPGSYWTRAISCIGSPESIATYTQQDVIDYWNERYDPHNVSIVSAGGIAVDDLVEIIEKSMLPFQNHLPCGKHACPRSMPIEGPQPAIRGIYKFDNKEFVGTMPVAPKGSYRAHVHLPFSADRSTVRILLNMVNHVLFYTIREKMRATYDVSADFITDSLCKSIKLSCDSFDVSLVDIFVPTVIDAIKSIENRKELFDDMLAIKLASYQFEDSNVVDVVSGASSDIVAYGRVRTLSEEIEEYKNLRFSDVQKYLEYLHPDYMFTTLYS